MNGAKIPPLAERDFHVSYISRILFKTTIYLGPRSLADSSGSSMRHFLQNGAPDTTLHRGKDLAVAPRALPRGLFPKEPFAVSGGRVSVRTSRITRTGVTRYPAAGLACARPAGVRTFLMPLFREKLRHAVAYTTHTSIQHLMQLGKQ